MTRCQCDAHEPHGANKVQHPDRCKRHAAVVISLQYTSAVTSKTHAKVCRECLYDDDEIIRELDASAGAR